MKTAWWILLACCFLLGCNQYNVCGETRTDIVVDGGLFQCLDARDCPRHANVVVCLNNQTQIQDCVQCTNNRCVQIAPVPCP